MWGLFTPIRLIALISVALSAIELDELLSVSGVAVFKLAKASRNTCFEIGTCVLLPAVCCAMVEQDVIRRCLRQIESDGGDEG